MKKLFFIASLFLCSLSQAEITRNGNTFTSNRTAHRDTLVTEYKFVTDGKTYPVIINRNTGSCYVWRTSKKTGKAYRMYMKKEISAQIAKEILK